MLGRRLGMLDTTRLAGRRTLADRAHGVVLSLVRLYQYDDAKNVAAMIRKLEPVETEAHHQRFLQSLKVRLER